MAIPVFDLSQVTGIRKNSTTPPLISTRDGLIDGTRPGGGGDPEPGSETLFYELTFTGGSPNNVGAGNAHPGGGYIEFFANSENGVGTGISSTNIFADTVSDDPLFPGTIDVLRDTYFAGGTAYSFANQTIFGTHPESRRVYKRMRIKWSSNWQWGSDQLKFCKNKTANSGPTTNCPKFSGSQMNITKHVINPSTGADAYDGNVYATGQGAGDVYNINDDINNEFGGAGVDAAFTPVNGQWYWIEWEIDQGTPGLADGSYNIWIDGNLYMSLDPVQVVASGVDGFISYELGHVWENVGSDPLDFPTEDISMYWHSLAIYDRRPASLPTGIA